MDDDPSQGTDGGAIDTLDVLLTAAEAFPAFERLFLEARTEIWAGFRVFDLSTALRSNEARAVGETWLDLFKHTLDRGVSITLIVTDFDPIIATDYHRKSWATAKQLASADELSGPGTLTFRVARHAARVGIFPRIALQKKVREKLADADHDELTPGLQNTRPGDLHHLVPATHHQKLAVFDRQKLYIGGLDLDERRFDTTEHRAPAEETWQDVQAVVTGPVVAAAQRHLETFRAVTDGEMTPPDPGPAFLRTLSAPRRFAPFHISPRTIASEIEQAHMEAIDRAEGLLYFETQYFRHLPLARALARAGRRDEALSLIMVMPAAPEDVAFEGNDGQDARMGEHLQAEAISAVRDAFGDRAVFCAPAQPRRGDRPQGRDHLADAPIIYVHSKVSIFGTREAIISSANLNGRSLRWDTEAGIRLTRHDHVVRLRDRLFRHWMPDVAPGQHAPADVVRIWREAALANAEAPPEGRRSLLLPYDHDAARAFGAPVRIVPNELV